MPEIQPSFGKGLILLGGFFMLLGVFFTYQSKIPFLSKLWPLPLDFKIERENFKFYFPLGTSILMSVLLTLLVKIFGGFTK